MKNISIKDFLTIIKFKLAESCEFKWNCYGPYSYSLNWSDGKNSAEIIYDSKTQKVYQLEIWEDLKAYIWIKREYKKAYKKEKHTSHKYQEISSNKALNKLKQLVKSK